MTNLFKISPGSFQFFVTAFFLSGFCVSHHAAAATEDFQDLTSVRAFVVDFLNSELSMLKGAPTVEVAELDKKIKLKRCDSMSAYLGYNKLIGNTTVAVKCLSPATWTIQVRAKTELVGEYVVAASQIAAGHPINEKDISVKLGPLSGLPPSVAKTPADAVGKMLSYAASPGTPLRTDAFRKVFNIQAGQPVVIRSTGPGFSISTEGIATTSAYSGQEARAKTASGQNISGITKTPGVIDSVF